MSDLARRIGEDQRKWVEDLFAENERLRDGIEDALDALVEAQTEASHGLTANGQHIDGLVKEAIVRLREVNH